MTKKLTVSLLDYGAGNVRSVRNAIASCGYAIVDITEPSQIAAADVIVFPGVGSFHSAMTVLRERGYDAALREYLRADRPYLGICLVSVASRPLVRCAADELRPRPRTRLHTHTSAALVAQGMQTLFESSEENSNAAGDGGPLPGLGVIPGRVVKFDAARRSVPHIGWNGAIPHQRSPALRHAADGREEWYFVHSYYAPLTAANAPWVLTRTSYEGQEYVSSVQRGNVVATQFHPEKSGTAGLRFLRGFLEVRPRVGRRARAFAPRSCPRRNFTLFSVWFHQLARSVR